MLDDRDIFYSLQTLQQGKEAICIIPFFELI